MSGNRFEQPSDGWFRARGEAAGDVFFISRVIPDRAVEFVSDTVEDLLGITAADVYRDPVVLYDRVDPRDAAAFEATFQLPPGSRTHFMNRWTAADGRAVWTEVVIDAVARADGSVVLEGTAHDISAMKAAEKALVESEQRYRLLAENAWDVIWTMEIDGTISYVSPAVERVRGITPEEARAQTLDQIHPPESAAKVADYFGRLYAAMAEGTVPPPYRGQHDYYRKDGSIMHGELDVIPQVDDEGKVIRILGVTRDISEQRRYESELSRLAVTDPLTGVWNRRHGESLFSADLVESPPDGAALSLLVLDIDHFKDINDTYGHHVGDKVLIELTRRLTETLRASDVLVRWGGEEFVIGLRSCTVEDALARAEEIRGRIADEPFEMVGTVTVSIGAAELSMDDDLQSWMDRADMAMYAAKAAGRNAVRAAA